MHAYTYAAIHRVQIPTHLYIYPHISIHISMHAYTYAAIHLYISTTTTHLYYRLAKTHRMYVCACMCVCVCVWERECVCMCVPQQTDHLHIFFVNFRFLNTIFQPCLHTNMKTYSRSHVCVSVRVCVYVCVCMCVCVCVYVCVWPPCDFHKYFFWEDQRHAVKYDISHELNIVMTY